MPARNLSSMSVDALLKLRDDIEKALSSRALSYGRSFPSLAAVEAVKVVEVRLTRIHRIMY
jgi:hypothetical protein